MIWLSIIGRAIKERKDVDNDTAQKTSNLMCHLYRIGCSRRGPYGYKAKDDSMVFVMHAVYAYCKPFEVLESWYEDEELTNNRFIEPLMSEHDMLQLADVRRTDLYGIPDFALDEHTKAGRHLSRRLKFSIEVGCKLTGVYRATKEQQVKYMGKVLQRLTDEGLLPLSVMSLIHPDIMLEI